MKIESIRIQNFRSFKDETILLNDYNCFIGANGSGKSTVLNALNLFFKQMKDSQTDLSRLSEDDFHHKNTEEEISITLTFKDLSEEAKQDFSNYVRQDKLIVSAKAIYDSQTRLAEVKQYGNRLGIEEFRVFFEADKNKATAGDLSTIYKNFITKFPDLEMVKTKEGMKDNLRRYEEAHPDRCILIPSEDQFYGWSKGINKLQKYIQWIFIPASKDITEESQESKDTALGQLIARTVRSKVNFSDSISALRDSTRATYQQLLDNEQDALNDISLSITTRLSQWSHPDISAKLNWKQDQDKSVKIEEPSAVLNIGERGFESQLNRFGHGLQRSYMLAILQELTSSNDENAPTLLMGIEEPEIYQHPPQIRYLSDILLKLSDKSSQIFVCTHSPLFIPGEKFDSIRLARSFGSPVKSTIHSLTYINLAQELQAAGESRLKEEGMVAKLYPSLNPLINEMFFCRFIIFVEGIEDSAYLHSYINLMDKYDEYRSLGCHIVPVGGKSNLIKPIAIAKLLQIPFYVIFDADTDSDEKYHENHKLDNLKLIKLLGYDEKISDWPTTDVWERNLTIWSTNITVTVKNEIGQNFENIKNQVEQEYKQPGGLDKNPLAIAKFTEIAWNKGVKSISLEKLIINIITCSKQ